jgi:hypothetical protein
MKDLGHRFLISATAKINELKTINIRSQITLILLKLSLVHWNLKLMSTLGQKIIKKNFKLLQKLTQNFRWVLLKLLFLSLELFHNFQTQLKLINKPHISQMHNALYIHYRCLYLATKFNSLKILHKE